MHLRDKNGKSARDVGNRAVQSLFDTYQAKANFQSKPNSDQQILATYSIQSARKCISQALQDTAKIQSEELFSIASDIFKLSLETHIHRESVLTTGLIVERILRHPILLGPRALSPVLQVLQDLRKLYQKTLFTVVPSKLQLNKSDRGKITDFAAILFHLQDQLREATQNLKIDLNIQVVGDTNDLSHEFGKAMETMRSLGTSLQSFLSSSEQRRQRDGLSDLSIQLQRGLECYQRQVALRNAPSNNDLESQFRLSQDKIEETLKIIQHTQNFPETFRIDTTESWLLSSKDVEFDTSSQILGSGAFGTVFKGKYQGEDVAIKRFDKIVLTDSADIKKAIANEVRAWKKVSHEPYILTLFGVCVNTVTPTLVSELCQTNIRRYVRDRPETLIPVVYQFAKGLAAIHNAVAIGDFGISRTATSLEKTTIGGNISGTLNWMSPEQYLRPRRVTTKSDIWSFGMTLWEILCNDIPFRDCCEHEFKDSIFVSEEDRPAKPDHVTPALEPLWTLITHCWHLYPFDRPSAIEIVKYLEIHYKSQLNINNGSYASTENCVQSIEWVHQLKLTHVQTNHGISSISQSEEIPDFFHSGVDVHEPWIDASQTMNHPMEIVNMASGSDSISSQGQQDDGAQLEVYSFDLSKYKDGSYKLVTAVDPMVHFSGRFLKQYEDATRKIKVNTVQFDWPHSSFSIHVKHTRSVGIQLKGEGNYFNVFVDGQFTCILRATIEASCYDVAQFYNDAEHTITISKRTEPQMCGAVSTFKVCTFYGFIVDKAAVVLPYVSPYTHRMEFIGDSDTCGYGNEGAGSSSKGMKGRFENVYNGYACITSRMFNAETHVLAWSGKGVKSNFADWGPNMSSMWKNVIASRDFPWDMYAWQPEVVVINLGTQDLFPPVSSETEIVEAYTALLKDVRMYRPEAHIFCVVCDENCMSGEEDHVKRSRISLQLQEITRVAMSKVKKIDLRMHYVFIKILGGLEPSDFANMRHYSVSGHVKFAEALAKEIAFNTKWPVAALPTTMPYPQAKNQTIDPSDKQC
ncbi:hypothetical protein AC1031_013993 [Aphanomyces cochlioides]|nr:hypothetical protein AC1031_013993 [Aphanomyces cochlioides]